MMAGAYKHQTVLQEEAVAALNIMPDGCYIDATYGRGGHSTRILEELGPHGRLLVIDKDPEAIAHAMKRQQHDSRLLVWQGAFSDFPEAMMATGISGKVNGILLDLGVSSPQLDDATRGFSFLREGDLDMRMNPHAGTSAADWLAYADENEIADVIWRYGEEKFSRRIARAIVKHRQTEKLVTTKQLAELIASVARKKEPGKHPATRSFQAIRIFINRELDDLRDCLQKTVERLAPQGRLVVISFHSLEDRIVKRFLQAHQRGPKLPKGLPVMADQFIPVMKMVGKAIKPADEEIKANVRSRSAIMRVGERTG